MSSTAASAADLQHKTRQLRLQLAWVNGDKPALDLVLDEVLAYPAGAAGLLFALIESLPGSASRLILTCLAPGSSRH